MANFPLKPARIFLMLTDEALSGATSAGDALLQEADQLDERELPRCIHAEQLETSIKGLLGGMALDEASGNICRVLDIYLEQPFLLSPHLASWIPPLARGLQSGIRAGNWPLAIATSRVLVAFCKVQGPKAIRIYFEHGVGDFVTVLLACRRAFEHASELGLDGWQVRHGAMIMSSMVLLLPFNLQKLNAKAAAEGHPLLLSQVTDMVKAALAVSGGRERQAAVLFLSALLARGDGDPSDLGDLLQSAIDRLSGPDPPSALGFLECIHAVIKRRGSGSLDAASLLDSLDGVEGSKSGHLRQIRLKIYSQCRGPWAARSLNALVSGLSDAETIVRWTASKGCAKLCKDLCPDTVKGITESLLTALSANLASLFPSAPMCHGISLTLAQLCRFRLLPEGLIEPLIQVTAKDLLRFEAPRGKFATTGTAVRDAACFIVWAMVRNYRCATTCTLPGALICTGLFDREVGCRRAAAAALQELVGRWDAPHGVELLGRINFFDAHHLRQTMGGTAKEIAAAYPIYKPAMLEYLLSRSIRSWDRQVRTLAAPLLAHLINSESSSPLGEQLLLMAQCPDDIGAQHGAILTLSWLSFKDGLLLSRTLPATLLLDRTSPKMLGWELIAEAVHRLIASICHAAGSLNHPIDEPIMDAWLRGVSQALQSRDATLHELVSLDVLPALVSLHPAGSPLISDFFRGSVLPAADKDRNLNAQRGYTLAIAALPDWLFQERLAPLSKLLVKFIRGGPGIQIEKRINAIRVASVLYGRGRVHASAAVIDDLACTTLEAMDDYTVDARGDVGSLVRLAAMEALPALLSGEQAPSYEARLARHLFDKLDKLRRRAIQLFPQPVMEAWGTLLEAASDAPRFMALWGISPLRDAFAAWSDAMRTAALLGLISSAGSVNQLVAAPAGSLLHAWLDHGIVQQASLLATMSQQCSGRLQRAILVLLSRMPRFDPDLTGDLVTMIQTVASNVRTNMHDVLVAVSLLVRLAPVHPPAASWVTQAAASHPFPRVRQACLGNADGTW